MQCRVQKDTSDNEVAALFGELLSEYVDFIKLYTDGSKTDDMESVMA